MATQDEIIQKLKRLKTFEIFIIPTCVCTSALGCWCLYAGMQLAGLLLIPLGIFDFFILNFIFNKSEFNLKQELENENGKLKRY